MTFEQVRFKTGHADVLLDEGLQPKGDNGAMFKQREGFKHSYTILRDGHPIWSGGIIPYWAKRGHAWMLFGRGCAKNFVPVFRAVHQILRKQTEFDRIETDVPTDFLQAHRRALLLGFRLEVPRAQKYSPTGEDRAIYIWVRED